MQTYRLTIEYEGTRYSGWQEQRDARTVQGALRAAAEEFLGERVDLGGSGRTDAGVHALAQVAHLRARNRCPPRDLLYALNDRLPADVNVLSVESAPREFHARHDAVARAYVYQIATRRTAFGKRFVWWVRDPLDERAMARAAEMLVGRHDFARFSEPRGDGSSTIVEVEQSGFERHGDLLVYRVVASHFLWKMVRRVVGVLATVGRGRAGLPEIARLLGEPAAAGTGGGRGARDERGGARGGPQGGPQGAGRGLDVAALTAPPSGLFLERVFYAAGEPRGPIVAPFPVPRA